MVWATQGGSSCGRCPDQYSGGVHGGGARHLFDEMPSHREATPGGVLHVTVSHVLYPVNEEVLHQVFDAYGAEQVVVFERADHVEALVRFRLSRDAEQAREVTHGRCVYDGCCWLDVQYMQPTPSDSVVATPATCSSLGLSHNNNVSMAATTSAAVTLTTSTTSAATTTTFLVTGAREAPRDELKELAPEETSKEPKESVQELCKKILATLNSMIESGRDVNLDTSSKVVEPAGHYVVSMPTPPATVKLSDIIVSSPVPPVAADLVRDRPEHSDDHKVFEQILNKSTVVLWPPVPECIIRCVIVEMEVLTANLVAGPRHWVQKQPWPPPIQFFSGVFAEEVSLKVKRYACQDTKRLNGKIEALGAKFKEQKKNAAWGTLEQVMTQALTMAGTDRLAVRVVCLAVSGVNHPSDQQRRLDWIRDLFLGHAKFYVGNDAVAALASGTMGKLHGCVFIAGSGSTAYGVIEDGKLARAAGAGPILGDWGSGHGIAAQALTAVIKAYDGCGPQTNLTREILRKLELSSPDELIGWTYADPSWARIAVLVPVVVSSPEEGDEGQLNPDTVCSLPTLIDPRYMPLLSKLVQKSVQLGRHQQFLEIYREICGSTLELTLKYLGVEYVTKEEVQRVQAGSLNAKIAQWIQFFRSAIKLLFAAERILGDQIFEGKHTLKDHCFTEVTAKSLSTLLSFGVAVTNGHNGIDVDKFDYICRDCRACGLGCNFRYWRLLQSMCVMGENGSELQLEIQKLFGNISAIMVCVGCEKWKTLQELKENIARKEQAEQIMHGRLLHMVTSVVSKNKSAGEIFDPSNASELALKHQKKGYHLVAYCGDTTSAWCDESQLKPFMTNYSQMEKQSSSDSFINSVNHALEELSRRILSGMSCSCLPKELSDNGMSYMIENSGLRDGVSCSTVKQAEILEYFSPENLLHYVKLLALSPGQGGDLLDLVIACSQLTSFYRSKGCPELASFQTGSAWVDNGMDTPPTKNVMLGEAVTVEVQPSPDKPKSGVLALRFLQLPWDPGGQTSMESAWGQAEFHRGKNVMNVGCRSWAARLDNASGLATRPNRLDWHQYIGCK